MAKRQIFIDLSPDSASDPDVSWLVVEPNAAPGPIFHGDLKTAANHAAGCKVTVWVRGSEILHTTVDLPNMNRQRLLKAIPFALEETVACDLSELHFALGQRTEKGALSVAIVAKVQVACWLERLHHAGIQADALCPLMFGLPVLEKTWTLFLTGPAPGDLALLRQSQQLGSSLELQNVLPYLTLAVEQCAGELRPQTIRVVTCDGEENRLPGGDDWSLRESNGPALDAEFEPEDLSAAEDMDTDTDSDDIDADTGSASSLLDLRLAAADLTLPVVDKDADNDTEGDSEFSNAIDDSRAFADSRTAEDGSLDTSRDKDSDEDVHWAVIDHLRVLCQANGIVLEQSSYHELPLRYYAEHFVDATALNILQGDYSRKEQLEKMFRPWIPTGAVAATWLLMQAGLLIANYVTLAERETQLLTQMDEVYAEAFPEAKQTKLHLREMKGRLAKLKTEESKESGFIPLLYQAGQVLNDTADMTISGIRYKSNKLDINMEIADLQALDALKEKLITKAQVNVEIVSASAREGKVSSRIQVEPKG